MIDSGSRQRDNINLAVLIGEFAFIVLLFWALSGEYRANRFMQAWVAQYAWPLAFFLNGYLAAILAGVLIGALGTYFQRVLGKRKNGSRG